MEIKSPRYPDGPIFYLGKVNPKFHLYGSWEPLGSDIYALWVGSERNYQSLTIKCIICSLLVRNYMYTKSPGLEVYEERESKLWELLLTGTKQDIELATLMCKLEGEHV